MRVVYFLEKRWLTNCFAREQTEVLLLKYSIMTKLRLRDRKANKAKKWEWKIYQVGQKLDKQLIKNKAKCKRGDGSKASLRYCKR